jgi:hypothetical protein
MNPFALEKFLWGKFYYIASEKKVVKNPPSAESQEMFVSFIMKPVVQQYRQIFNIESISNT